jgi:signal transduction histidine kinase/CheY-like chemotaxis protein
MKKGSVASESKIHGSDLFENDTLLIWKYVKFSLIFRYILLILLVVFELQVNNQPLHSHVFIVVLLLYLFYNVAINVIALVKNVSMLLSGLLFIDCLFYPFLFYYTGGFLSPFVIIGTLCACSISSFIKSRKFGSEVLLISLLMSYLLVSLLQKIGYLNNQVMYANDLMNNNAFFFMVISTVTISIAGIYFFIKNNYMWQMSELTNIYTCISEKIAGKTGKDYYISMIKSISEIFNVHTVFIGEFLGEGKIIEIRAIVENGNIIKNISFNITGTPYEKIQSGNYVFSRHAGLTIWSDSDSKKEYYCYAISIQNSTNKSSGMICLLNDKKIQNYYMIEQILRIFADKTLSELERKRIESEKTIIQEQLHQARKMEAIGKLAGGVAHDFNNQLNTIIGYTDLLAKKIPAGSTLSNYITGIISAAKSAAELTKKLLTFSRNGKSINVQIDIHNLIDELVAMLKHTFSDTNIRFYSFLNANKFILKGDPGLIQNMLLNLSLNGRDAMPDGGKLLFATENVSFQSKQIIGTVRPFEITEGTYLALSVYDNGTGMDKATLEHLFEPFFTTKKDKKGNGLGLATAWGCVKSHGGYIDVMSEKNVGSTFTIYLPVKELTSNTSASDSTNAASDSINVILINDNKSNLDYFGDHLNENGFRVTAFGNQSNALDYIKKSARNNKDIIIIDLKRPRQEIFELVQNLNLLVQGVRILLAIDENPSIYNDKSLQGLIYLLKKPITPDMLILEIKRIITGTSMFILR